MKFKIKQKAIKLRKQGFSLAQISERLQVAKSTASLWNKNTLLTSSALKRLQSRRKYGNIKAVNSIRRRRKLVLGEIGARVQNTIKSIRIDAEVSRLSCALLYWCEGEKNSSAVRFTNSDPVMINTFLALLRYGFELNESKFRICLHLHPYHNTQTQIEFWSRVTHIPVSQFTKVFLKKNSGITIKKDYPGCVSVRYHDYRIVNELKCIWELFAKKYNRRVV